MFVIIINTNQNAFKFFARAFKCDEVNLILVPKILIRYIRKGYLPFAGCFNGEGAHLITFILFIYSFANLRDRKNK